MTAEHEPEVGELNLCLLGVYDEGTGSFATDIVEAMAEVVVTDDETIPK